MSLLTMINEETKELERRLKLNRDLFAQLKNQGLAGEDRILWEYECIESCDLLFFDLEAELRGVRMMLEPWEFRLSHKKSPWIHETK